uniref:ATP-dependent Clp protease proteolytic subunit n=1 Tax=Brassica oleracea var. oleracea TaxID=109376 RepID=A0A0D3DXX6_BRAOL
MEVSFLVHINLVSEPNDPMGDKDFWKSISVSCDKMIAQLGEIMEISKNIQATLKQERMKKQIELETIILMESLELLVISEQEDSNLIESETLLQQDPLLVVLQSNNILVLESERSLNSKKSTIAPVVIKSSFLMESNNRESEKWLLPYGCLDIISWSLRTSSEWKRRIMIRDYGSKLFGSYQKFEDCCKGTDMTTGHVEDVRRQVNEAIEARQKIDRMYAAFTGQPLETVQQFTERDRFLSASEALEFGLIDGLLETEY